MVNPPMVKGYNVHHLLRLRHSKNGASVFRSHTVFPRSRKHGPKPAAEISCMAVHRMMHLW